MPTEAKPDQRGPEAAADRLAALPDGTALAAAWRQVLAAEPDITAAVPHFLGLVEEDHGPRRALQVITALVDGLAPRPWLLQLASRTALQLDDAEAAFAHASQFADIFAGHANAARLQIEAALASGRMALAEKLLAALGEAESGDAWALRARLTLLEHRRALAPLLSLAQEFRAKFPGQVDAWVAEAHALGLLGRHAAAASLLAAAKPKFGAKASWLKGAAEAAVLAGDIDLAIQHWAALRDKFREDPAHYLAPLQALARANRDDVATPIIAEGLARFPAHPRLLRAAAAHATRCGNKKDAERYTRRLMKLLPDDPAAGLAAIWAIRGPRPGRAARLPEVARRLALLNAQFPDFVPGFTAHVRVLKELGELARAKALSAEWCARFPQDIDLAFARADVLEDLGEAAATVAEFAALRDRLPHVQHVLAAYIRALSICGEHEEADREVAAAIERYPANRIFALEAGNIATRRGDWAEALERLKAAAEKFPDDKSVAKELRTARLMVADTALLEAPADGPPNDFAIFESLGGSSIGCEIGLVQRQFGCNAVGLLRWSAIGPDALIAALRCGFEGVGEEANTILNTVEQGRAGDQYRTLDSRFGMYTHTFVRVADAPRDKMFTQSCRRLRFLRGKMLEDLAKGEKIFMYKPVPAISDAQVRAIHAALATQGGRALLCVMKAERASQAGTVRVLGPGIYVGYVSFVMSTGTAGADYPNWRKVMRETLELWQADGAGGAKPIAEVA